jgi:hypothetical protein
MGGLFSSSQTGQEGADDFGVCDGTDNLHAGAALGACHHVDGEDAGHQIGPRPLSHLLIQFMGEVESGPVGLNRP